MLLALHVTIDVATISFVAGTLIPILVALVTRQSASPGIKAAVNLLLSIVAGALSAVVASATGEVATLEVGSFVTSIGTAWITSIATHYGLLKPTGVTGTAGVVQRNTANVGIGGGNTYAPPQHHHGP